MAYEVWSKKKDDAGEKLTDVAIYSLELAGIDLGKEIETKIAMTPNGSMKLSRGTEKSF